MPPHVKFAIATAKSVDSKDVASGQWHEEKMYKDGLLCGKQQNEDDLGELLWQINSSHYGGGVGNGRFGYPFGYFAQKYGLRWWIW